MEGEKAREWQSTQGRLRMVVRAQARWEEQCLELGLEA